MTAPERIWVGDERPVGGTIHVWNELAENARRYATEYIRADLVPDPAAIVRAALEAAAEKAQAYCHFRTVEGRALKSPAVFTTHTGQDMADLFRAIAADALTVPEVKALVEAAKEYRLAIEAFDGTGPLSEKIATIHYWRDALDAALRGIGGCVMDEAHYQGPIEVGMTFIWRVGTIHQEAIVVTRVHEPENDERRIWVKHKGGEHWNDESAFREAVALPRIEGEA